jgi:hypothetical protein
VSAQQSIKHDGPWCLSFISAKNSFPPAPAPAPAAPRAAPAQTATA